MQLIAPTYTDNQTPLPISPGRTAQVTVQHYVESGSYGRQVGVTFRLLEQTSEGVGSEVASLLSSFVVAPDSRPVTRTYNVPIPQTIPEGGYYLVVDQASSYEPGHVSSNKVVLIQKAGVVSDPIGDIASARSDVARKTIKIFPFGGVAGTVSLSTNLGGALILPSSLTFSAASEAPQTVDFSYAVPANAPGTRTGLVLTGTVDESNGFRAEGGVTYEPIPVDFSVTATPSRLNVVGGQVQGSTTFTITPTNGFRGTVNVTLALPGNGSLSVTSPSNPFSVTIDSDTPASRTITYRYSQVNGGTAPIGTATITAVGGGKTHSAQFEFSAS